MRVPSSTDAFPEIALQSYSNDRDRSPAGTIKRSLAGLLIVLLAAPSAVFAQAPKAGVVTTLEGNVSARRVALPDPVPLKFKDDIFLQDTVTTGDRSLARMLLGGKAVVTVRERSVLTITEVPGRTTIDLDSGKFALAVAREKMRPGEEIQIRTPNAVAGVRGTVVITQVERQGAQVTPGVPAVVTNFFVLRGEITAQRLDAARNPFGAPFQISTMQNFSAAGLATPRVQPVLTEHIARITSGLQPTGPKAGGDAGKEQVKTQALQGAVALLSALSGGTQLARASAPTHTYSPSPGQHVRLNSKFVDACKGAASKGTSGTSNTGCEDLLNALNAELGFALFSSDFTSTSPVALFDLINRSLTFTSSFIKLLQGITVLLAGPLVHFTNSRILTGGSLLDIQGGTLRSTGTSALIASDPTLIGAAQSIVLMNGGTLTLAGPLLTDTDGTIVALQEFLKMTNSATLTSTGTGALVQLDGTSVFATAALSMKNSTMTLAGPLLTATEVDLVDPTVVAAALQALGLGQAIGTSSSAFLLDNSRLTSTGAGALIQLTNTDFDVENGNFIRLVNGSTLTLSGPLLSATNSDIFTGDDRTFSTVFIADGSQVRSTDTAPFITVTDTFLDTSGTILSLRRSTGTPTRLTLAGPLFSATNSNINHTSLAFGATFETSPSACCAGFFIAQGAQLSSTTASALIQLTNSTVTGLDSQSGGNFFQVSDSFGGAPAGELVAPASVSLAGPLLNATTSTITSLFDLVLVRRSSFTSTSSNSLIGLSGGSVTVGGIDVFTGSNTFGRLLLVLSANTSGLSASAASMNLAGPLVSMSGGALLTTNFDVLSASNGGTFTSTSTTPLMSLNNARITQVLPAGSQFGGAILSASGLGGPGGTTRSTINLSGGLLNAINGSVLNFPGRLVVASNGGQIIETHPTAPFVALDGGAHTIGTLSNFAGTFGLFGRATNTVIETILANNLTIGTDQPLLRTGAGAFLALTNGATVNTHQPLLLDTAVLAASAPLLEIRGATSSLTTATDSINLNQRARLTSIGPVLRIDGGIMNVNSGSAFRVAGGSALVVNGDLLSLNNAAQLNILNGGAIFASGSSVVNISGALVNFGGIGGNQLNITNTLCGTPCTAIGGINVALQNGAVAGNVSITNPVKNSALGAINLSNPSTSAVIVVNGVNSKVQISGN